MVVVVVVVDKGRASPLSNAGVAPVEGAGTIRCSCDRMQEGSRGTSDGIETTAICMITVMSAGQSRGSISQREGENQCVELWAD